MFVINANTRQSYLGGYAPTSGCYIPAIDGSSINLYFNRCGNKLNANPDCYTLENGFKYSTILIDQIYPNIYLCSNTSEEGKDNMDLGGCNRNGLFNLNFNALSLTPLKSGIIGKKICHNLFVTHNSYRNCTSCVCGAIDLCLLHSDGTSTCVANLLNRDSGGEVANQCRYVHDNCLYRCSPGSLPGLPKVIRTSGTQAQEGDCMYLNIRACFCNCGGNTYTGMQIFNGPFYHSASNSYSFHCYPTSQCRTFPIQISVE